MMMMNNSDKVKQSPIKLLLGFAALAMVFVSTCKTNAGVARTVKAASNVAVYEAHHNDSWKLQELEELVHIQQESIQKLQETVRQLVEDKANITTRSQPLKANAPDEQLEELDEEALKLAKDRDAWYGDIAKSNNAEHNLNITIRLTTARHDRLGSNTRRPLFLSAYANCKGYKFCIQQGREGVAGIFPFPSCPPNLLDFSPPQGDLFNQTTINTGPEKIPVPPTESGTYSMGNEALLLDAIRHQMDPKCTFSNDFRSTWRDMVLRAANHSSLNTTLTQQDLFHKDKDNNNDNDRITTIAVNIRRGDVTSYKRAIWDEVYVKLLQQLRPAVERTGRIPQVHLFSEDYGMIDARRQIAINWTLYDGLVDYFHLAPDFVTLHKKQHAMDVSLNMRDWRHFLTADILVVGGTFAEIPAFGRPRTPDPQTGAGLTLYPCPTIDAKECQQFKEFPRYIHSWSSGNGGRMDQVELVNMPESLASSMATTNTKS